MTFKPVFGVGTYGKFTALGEVETGAVGVVIPLDFLSASMSTPPPVDCDTVGILMLG